MPTQTIRVVCEYLCDHCTRVFDSHLVAVLHERDEHRQPQRCDKGTSANLESVDAHSDIAVDNLVDHSQLFMNSDDAAEHDSPMAVDEQSVTQQLQTQIMNLLTSTLMQQQHDSMTNETTAAAPAVQIKAEPDTPQAPSLSADSPQQIKPAGIMKRSLDATLARLNRKPILGKITMPIRATTVTPAATISARQPMRTSSTSGGAPYKPKEKLPPVTAADLICRLCHKTFTVRANRIRHEATSHSDHRGFACPLCDKDFKRKDQLRSHMQHRHGTDLARERRRDSPFTLVQEQQLAAGAAESTTFNCDLCERTFTRRDHLKRHRHLMHRGLLGHAGARLAP